MNRRPMHVVLLVAGLAPLFAAVVLASSDPRRAAVLGALAALGIGLNGLGLAKRGFAVRGPLRLIACAVSLVVLAGVLAMWQWLRAQYLPSLPKSEVGARLAALRTARDLLLIAATLGYVIVAILLLPRPSRSQPPSAPQSPDRPREGG